MAKTFDDKKIIYTMSDVSRAYGTKVVLKNISISYFYGAKIGVIGPNGSGKSSLFKILAGIDNDFTGETTLAPGYTIGYLEQEPQLEAGKTVKEVVSEGVKEIKSNAFKGCSKLSELTIPNSCVKIGEGILTDCIKLEKLTIPTTKFKTSSVPILRS